MKSLIEDIKRYIYLNLGDKRYSYIGKLLLVFRKPSIFAIAVHRYGYWVQDKYPSRKHKPIRVMLNSLYYLGKKICMFRGKYDILDTTPIGPGFVLSDKGHAVIGAVQIGSNVTISYNVTVGMDMEGRKPTIGDNTVISNNSIVYGAVNIGDGSVIESSSVLTRNIPEAVSVKGNPVKMTGKNIDSSDYLNKHSNEF